MYLEVHLPTAQVSYQTHLQISLALLVIHLVVLVTFQAPANHQITTHRAAQVIVHHPVRIQGQHPVIYHQILVPEASNPSTP
jgi:hypothetical protein